MVAARPASASAVHRYFEISLFLLVTVGFLGLASTGRLDILSLLVVSAALVTKALRYRRHRKPELSPRTVTALTWFYFAFYSIDWFFLSGSFLMATTHLLLFIGMVKLFSARTNRDYLWLALVAFMQVLAAATLTVDTTYLVFFFLFLVLGISTFISYEIKRGTETAQTVPLAAGSPAGRRLERSLLATSLTVALATLLVATILFFLLPRFTTGYMSAYGSQPEQISGFTNEVSLGDIGRIKLNPTVVMRLRAQEGPPRQLEGLKWRGVALTRFDGQRWSTLFRQPRRRLRPFGGRFHLPVEEFRELPLRGRVPRRLVRYRVLLEPISAGTLFAATVPVQIRGRFQQLWVDENGSLNYFQAGYAQVGYEAVSDIGRPSPDLLRAAPSDYSAVIREPYLQLPPLDPRVPELAQSVTAAQENPYDKARELERYLRTQFGYTLELPSEPEEDPIAEFLFQRRQGHCEYFAAAMTVLLRSLDIPARVVNGFLTGEYNEVGENYMVRARDAHTWVEVFFPGVGWVEFDPTPPDPNPPAYTWWTTAQHYLDAFDLWWDEWVINYDYVRQVQLARSLRDTLRWARQSRYWFREKRRELTTGMHDLGEGIAGSPYALPVGLGLLLTVGLVLRGRVLVGGLRAYWVLRSGAARNLSAAEATLVYRRLLTVLRRKGCPRRPEQTPLEFAASLPWPELAAPVGEFTRLYNAVRFGEHTAPTPRLVEILRGVETWKSSR